MDLFGIGPLNLILIFGVMLIVFGPDRLPEMAARAGKLLRDLRAYASDMTGEFSGELAEIQQHFVGVQDDLRSFGQEIRQTSSDIGGSIRDATSGPSPSSESSVAGVNAPPPAPDKVVPLPNAAPRPRVDDYKPG
jgi:sec-independent protein translocase protein TatB